MTAPKPPEWEPWEGDPAHRALGQWLRAFRDALPDRRAPALRFAGHLGRHAVELMSAGMGRVELERLFWQIGEVGECPCGIGWDQPVPEPEPEPLEVVP